MKPYHKMGHNIKLLIYNYKINKLLWL